MTLENVPALDSQPARERVLSAVRDDAPAEAVRWALQWLVQHLAERLRAAPPAQPPDDALLDLAVALDLGITQSSELPALWSRLTAAAGTGEAVRTHVDRLLADLRSVQASASRLRTECEQLRLREQDLRAAEQERHQLQQHLDDLRQLERRVTALPQLRQEEALLRRRLDVRLADLSSAEDALLETAAELVVLSTDQLRDAREDVRTVLRRLRDAEQEWRAQRLAYKRHTADLADIAGRIEELERAMSDPEGPTGGLDLAGLAEYREADARLAEALSLVAGHPLAADVAGVRDALGTITRQLRNVDSALQSVLTLHQQRVDQLRRILNYADEDGE